MPNVTKKDLIDGIAERTGEKRATVRSIVEELLTTIRTELSHGNRIELRDFGIFEIKRRAPRLAQNPKTLEKVRVPAKGTVKFKPGRRLKRRIDAGVSADEDRPDPSSRGQSGSDVPDVTVLRSGESSMVETKSVRDQSTSPNK